MGARAITPETVIHTTARDNLAFSRVPSVSSPVPGDNFLRLFVTLFFFLLSHTQTTPQIAISRLRAIFGLTPL